MKINHIGNSTLIQKYGTKVNRSQNSQKEKKTDQLSLSGKVKDLQKIKQKVDYSPDIRSKKVAELKEQVRQGTYNVNGEEVAGKIVDKVLNKKV